MNTRILLAGAAVVLATLIVVAAVIVGLFVVAPTALADRDSQYDYSVRIETNDTLTDVTLYLPIPVGPDGPMTGAVNVRDDDGQSVANTSGVVETDHGPMLAIETDRMEGHLEYLLLTFDDGNLTSRERISPDEVPTDMTNRRLSPIQTVYTVHVIYEWIDDGDPIETRDPIGVEPTLSPAYNATPTDCGPGSYDESDGCYDFETAVYADYETAADNVVHVSGEYSGWNEWGWGLSNSYNAFTERVERTALAGPQADWAVLPGARHTGEGSYPTRGN